MSNFCNADTLILAGNAGARLYNSCLAGNVTAVSGGSSSRISSIRFSFIPLKYPAGLFTVISVAS